MGVGREEIDWDTGCKTGDGERDDVREGQREREEEGRKEGMGKEAGHGGWESGAMFCVCLSKPPMEDQVGQPHSYHWTNEDSRSYSVHCDGHWGSHNGRDGQGTCLHGGHSLVEEVLAGLDLMLL